MTLSRPIGKGSPISGQDHSLLPNPALIDVLVFGTHAPTRAGSTNSGSSETTDSTDNTDGKPFRQRWKLLALSPPG